MSAIPKISRYITRGDDWVDTLGFTIDSVAEDVSGSTFTATIRDIASRSGNTIGSITIDTSDAANGNLGLTIPDTVTELMTGSTYYADIQEVTAAGLKETRARYTFTIEKDITE